MSEKYSPVKGDRVRVVLEGEVADDLGYAFTIEVGDSGARSTISLHGEGKHVVSVEKIKQPVTVFRPGDVVRSKEIFDYHYTLGKGKYVNKFGSIYDYEPGAFTSEDYELVDLSK